MRNRMALLIIVVIVWCAFGVFLASEAKFELPFFKPSLAGSWEAIDHDWSIWVSSFPEEVQFNDDGTASLDNIASTYSVEGSTVNIKASWAALSYEFSVNGDTLVLTADDESVTYEKVE